MFCIQLICNTGGSKTILGNTIEECKKNCAAVKGDWLAAIVPYEVEDIDWPFETSTTPMYNVSVPSEWWVHIGVLMLEKYKAEQ